MSTKEIETIDLNNFKMTPEMKLMEYLFHAKAQNSDLLITEQDIDYMIAWVGVRPHMPPQESKMVLHQLGLSTTFGTVNKKRALLISEYIWNKHPAKPDFPTLLKWLETNHPREDIQFSTPTTPTPPKKTDPTKARKKKKQARKKAQKRNRKK